MLSSPDHTDKLTQTKITISLIYHVFALFSSFTTCGVKSMALHNFV